MNAIITDIQRFCLNDGDGIRTTVFFKGCNMRCTWCHNPETLSSRQEMMFYASKCIGCGVCVSVCPQQVHRMHAEGHVIDRTRCIDCGKCAEVCYAQAAVMCGKTMTVEDVMCEVRADKAYYAQDGGVTLSGGEVLLQQSFAEELVDACRAEGIRVALETNLSLPFEQIRPLLEKTDQIMCDIKIFDAAQHKKYTGIDNAVILENVRALDILNIPFIVRTPLVPQVTDSVENITAIATFIRGLKNLQRYELLNFNPLGAQKYQSLGRADVFALQRPLTAAQLQVRLQAVAALHVPCKSV